MSRKILLILALSVVIVLGSFLVFSSQKEAKPSIYRLADLKDLTKYPEIIPKGGKISRQTSSPSGSSRYQLSSYPPPDK